MRVDFLYTAGCPGRERALVRLQEALRETGAEAEIILHRVGTPEEAEALRFPGSPTIRIEGRDIEPVDGIGLCCRAYRQGDGSVAPVPSREAIEAALFAVLGRPPPLVDTSLAPGAPAPKFLLPGIDGQRYSLASWAGSAALVVVFLANHCPYAAAWERRLVALARKYGRKHVAFVAVCSSDTARFPADTPAHMAERARDCNFPFPYLYDSAQRAARAFGASHTPHVFLFDAERRLRYRGAIDSDWEGGPGTVAYLAPAIEAVLRGEEIALPVTRPFGSRIRYRG